MSPNAFPKLHVRTNICNAVSSQGRLEIGMNSIHLVYPLLKVLRAASLELQTGNVYGLILSAVCSSERFSIDVSPVNNSDSDSEDLNVMQISTIQNFYKCHVAIRLYFTGLVAVCDSKYVKKVSLP